jgi:hypothetical protein
VGGSSPLALTERFLKSISWVYGLYWLRKIDPKKLRYSPQTPNKVFNDFNLRINTLNQAIHDSFLLVRFPNEPLTVEPGLCFAGEPARVHRRASAPRTGRARERSRDEAVGEKLNFQTSKTITFASTLLHQTPDKKPAFVFKR